jgi:hypothetical protein
MAKKQAQGGIQDLLNPNRNKETSTKTAITEVTEQSSRLKSPRGTTVRVCYNLNAELIAKVKAVAHYDRKNINEIFNEALQNYIDNWQPIQQEPPKF